MYLLFDIGGSHIRMAVSHDDESFHEPVIFNTPQDFPRALEMMKEQADTLTEGKQILAAVGGVPGEFDVKRDILLRSPNLSGWNGAHFKQELAQTLGVPVYFANDTAMVGLGEAHFGAGKGYEILLYITVSTGVGGARIVGGRIDKAAVGFEPGWQFIYGLGAISREGNEYDALEYFISGRSVATRYNAEKATDLKDPRVWDEAAKLLAYGLYNTIRCTSPHGIVLGGSVMKSIDIEKVRQYLQVIEPGLKYIPDVKRAALGDQGGLYGALSYIQNIS